MAKRVYFSGVKGLNWSENELKSFLMVEILNKDKSRNSFLWRLGHPCWTHMQTQTHTDSQHNDKWSNSKNKTSTEQKEERKEWKKRCQRGLKANRKGRLCKTEETDDQNNRNKTPERRDPGWKKHQQISIETFIRRQFAFTISNKQQRSKTWWFEEFIIQLSRDLTASHQCCPPGRATLQPFQ